MKSNLTLLALLITINAFSQTIGPKIPWAQVQPEFIFPLYFENGDGQRDTFYLAIQNGATTYTMDTVYGEMNLSIDTTRFNILSNVVPMIYYYKAVVAGPDGLFMDINALNPVFPISISWDTTLFSYYHQLYYPKYLTYSTISTGFGVTDLTTQNELVLPYTPIIGGTHNWFPFDGYFFPGDTYSPVGTPLEMLNRCIVILNRRKYVFEDFSEVEKVEVYTITGVKIFDIYVGNNSSNIINISLMNKTSDGCVLLKLINKKGDIKTKLINNNEN